MQLLSKWIKASWESVPRVRGREDGNAQVEFIGVVAIFVIPLVYAIVSFSQVQAAQYAVTSSAHAIARAAALGQNDEQVRLIAQLALGDQGFEVDDQHLKIGVECAAECAPEIPVTSRVQYSLSIPGLGWTGARQISVSAQGTSFRGVLQSNEH